MVNLMLGDCLERMKEIPDASVDMVLADPPYGTTACKWDSVIDLPLMWEQLKRIIKSNGAIVLFGQEPFSSVLRVSNLKMFKYDWVWDKKIPSGMCNAKTMPMRQNELIHVFIRGKNFYNPQMIAREKTIKAGGNKPSISAGSLGFKGEYKKTYTHKFPSTILQFAKVRRGALHPTQKPVELMEYLIKTYTQEGETVLDFTMGSGTTGVACKNLSRSFIGIEKDETYFKIAQDRIAAI